MCERIEKWLGAIKNSVARADLLSSTKCKNQLKKAVANPAVDFINMVLAPNLPEIVIQSSVKTARDHSISERIRAQIATNQEIDWGAYSYFTNPLVPVEKDHEYYRSPSARASLGRHHVFTIEYDDIEIIPPSVQFGWCRSPGKTPAQSVMGRLHRDLSQKFADYFGATVVWSGNKSCHIHIVFRTELIPTLPLNANLHDGFKRHWEKLKAIVSQHTGYDNPDPACAAPSQYRRLPYGRHQNGNPQLVLWEQYRERAAQGVSASFFETEHFIDSAYVHKIQNSRTAVAVGG
ncbi:hypothetical protein [Rhodobacter capsulatus]|uniref:Uncharacterized protein n=2 Tax=Rhodobacter capsulatus TaxID=1061 RepID=A0A1G7SZ55_RHOCA|nr:hypothetical protein [Rhodobacter capsulatus]SDG27699.1 hypothetical protein SAMN04244550_03700 [Rhodobacter capsulatus]